jgi:hypothetical protein
MRKLSGPVAALCTAGLALLVPASSLAGANPGATPKRPLTPRPPRALLHSHELWATIDVCNTLKQPDTIGIRGSMPGDGRAHDEMFMSFHLQYLNAVNQWVELEGSSSSSAYIDVGDAKAARQGGWSFTLKPREGKPAFMLRGIVDFKWARGKTIVLNASRATTSGHESTAGAEPKDYSASSCSVG